MYKVLTIAGSDSSGGAGIQADIKTIAVHKMYAMSVVTALTAQNTTGVYGVLEAAPEFVAQQLDCVFTDIYPDAVKIGMVSNSGIIEAIAAKLKEYKARSIVVDPVMVSTSRCRLLNGDAEATLKSVLIPLGTVITPNIPEAEVLCGFPIGSEADMVRAARKIAKQTGGAVLVKGGHLVNDAGCTLSSAIACGLASGKTLDQSIREAKEYLTGALRAMLDLGRGAGPMDHTYCI